LYIGGIVLKFTSTSFLIFTNVLVYAYTSIKSGSFLVTSMDVLRLYGQYNFAVVVQGWYWQLFASMFVHVNLPHLILNMFFLLIFGMRAEEFLKGIRLGLIYLASGLAGNVLTLLLPLQTVSAGASGAIFGIFGASVICMGKTFGMSVFTALIYSLLFLMLSASEGVNLLAHLGGLVTGLMIGYFSAKNLKSSF
jgi:rhomboid protease GluP